jgi:hypothetical protein
MPRKFTVIHHLLSQAEIDWKLDYFKDERDEFGDLFFDPNNPEHLKTDDTVAMKCVRCLFQEEAPLWVLLEGPESFVDDERQIPVLRCPKCNRGTMAPVDCFEEAQKLIALKIKR